MTLLLAWIAFEVEGLGEAGRALLLLVVTSGGTGEGALEIAGDSWSNLARRLLSIANGVSGIGSS